MRRSPLRNRVDPFGGLQAVPARGTLMGNRGGRLHDPETGTIRRRQGSRAWIACALAFKGRRREVMGHGYTELFFLDEAVALAAGHRPCFECRRAEARAFAAAWAAGHGLSAPPRAPEMDRVLDAERRAPSAQGGVASLPPGAVFARDGTAYLKLSDAVRPFGWAGWGAPQPLPSGAVERLTRPAVVAVLAAGYAPRLHPSAHS